MIIFLTQTFLLCATLWAAWSALHQYFFSTDLDNVPGPENASLTHGNFGQLLDVNGWEFNLRIAEQFGRVIRIFGAFNSKHLLIFDPKALHHVVVKDQNIFEESSAFFASNDLIFGGGLLSTQGEQHKKQRKMLNPVFSITHMRNLVPIFNDVAQKLEKTITSKVISGVQEIDMLHWMSRAALEMIGQSGLGYSFDSLVEGAEQHPFCEAAKSLVSSMSNTSLILLREYLLPILVKVGTPRFRRFLVDHIPWKQMRVIRDIVDTMDKTATQIYQEKKKALEDGDEALTRQVGQAKDLLSILMKANMEASEEDRLTETEVVGQINTFCFAATDTTSNALSRTLHLLSMHQDVQETLREEIADAHQKHGQIPYDELVALPFMDAVCRETLRLYPPAPRAMRVARQNIVLPLATPIKGQDGREMSSIVVPNNTKIFISILHANRDPIIWGIDALEWKPERWLSPLPSSVQDAHMPGVYSHLMTFLGGGRACIGFKFSQLEMKVVLSTLVSHFRFSPSKEEIVWELTSITTPKVKGSPGKSQLPLKVELVNRDLRANSF